MVENAPTPLFPWRLSSAVLMAAPLVQLTPQAPAASPAVLLRKPGWLRVQAPGGPNYLALKHLMRDLQLHTVCEEAHCPNIGECWEHRAATFMILGDVCTRNCAYCAVAHGTPRPLDPGEPARLAEAVARMGLKHVVITSVDRDDLPHGGAETFAACVAEIRRRLPETSVEVLIPDFKGSEAALRIAVAARPDILNHNLETIERLYRLARPGGRHPRAPELPRRAKGPDPRPPTQPCHNARHGPACERRSAARAAAPDAAPDAAGAALRGESGRGVRARQDRRLLPPVHRAGGGGGGVPRRAARRRLRDLLLPRARPGAGPRGSGERGDGGTVRQGHGLLARQGWLDAPVRRRPAGHGRPRHRRRPHPARRGAGGRA